MIQRFTKGLTIALTLIALALPVMLTATAFAYDPFTDACAQGGGDSTVCKSKGTTANPLVGSNGVLTRVSNILAIIGGVIVVIMMIVGGIKYATSNGDSSQASSAKNTIIYGLVGLIVIILARGIIEFVVTKI